MMSWQAWSPPDGWPLGAPSVRWQRLAIARGHDISLWLFHVDAPSADTPSLTACLSPAEQARAQRFQQPLHAQRHRVTWAMVRHLLAHLTHRPVSGLAWRMGAHGKPTLADARLFFNLSHSGGWALLATSTTLELGVDIEERDSRSHLGEMSERILSEEERRQLDATSTNPEPCEALLQTWTRKEACLKALGVGLNREMHTLTMEGSQVRTASAHLNTHGLLPALSWADIALPADCPAWGACAWLMRSPQAAGDSIP